MKYMLQVMIMTLATFKISHTQLSINNDQETFKISHTHAVVYK